ncbi:ribosomal 40S subunit protein S18B [Mucor velutinosus]|uniref:Ribosomal 40S subunit protein S18B n=1 Tax=Mucor velutinosus TaxID=708070 RepID=A0AAN7HPX2_9FUNG|nr:ribosomal 40S subunit protein S18B [Mucor velutinosus]
MLSPINNDDDMDVVLSAAGMTEDIVEDFARQLDEVVRIQDAMDAEVDEVQEQRSQANDSDEDDDDDRMFGYQQLPQDDDEEEEHMYGQLASEDDDDENQIDIKGPLQIDVAEADQLQPETFDQIKSIMSNIRLSEEAIPGKSLKERWKK